MFERAGYRIVKVQSPQIGSDPDMVVTVADNGLDAIGGERIGIVFLGHQVVKLSGFPIQDVDPSVFCSYPYFTGRLHPESINLAVVQVAVIPGHWPESQNIDPIFDQKV